MNKLYKLTAFPKTSSGGNKAGVYLFADNLNDNEMQKIAYDLGYSETAFVMKSDLADFKVRFFTPLNEVDLCGHATIATFNLLRMLNIVDEGIFTQETKAGILKLKVKKNIVYMQQKPPVFFEFVDKLDLLNCFSNLKLNDDLLPQIVSTGIKEIFLPVKDITALNELTPNYEKIKNISNKYNVIGIHAFCLSEEVDAYSRNFAPIVGINEESATGTSNGALSCYLFKYLVKKRKYILRQGYSMGLPSEIYSEIMYDNNTIEEIWVGGSANIINKD